MKPLNKLVGACLSASLLAACAGGVSLLVPRGSGSIPDAFVPALATITVTPSKISLNSDTGAYYSMGGSEYVVVAERGYSGKFFADAAACQGRIARLFGYRGPNFGIGKGPKLTVVVYGLAPGSCTITFSDAKKHTTRLSITVVTSHYKVVHRFKDSPDGANPSYGDLIELHGVLYGTSQRGGRGACAKIGYFSRGCGTVFAVDPSSGVEHVVYAFKGGSDGQHPWSGLIAVNGLLYGTNQAGGLSYGCDSGGGGKGCGTVFEVNPSTGKERVIYAFNGHTNDGGGPHASLIAVKGALYGTTSSGGANHAYGTVFKMTPSASGYTESVLYSFKGAPDGAGPAARLLAFNGKLYGTTFTGGSGKCRSPSSNGCGTVFEVNMQTGAERVVYSFKGGSTDGLSPGAGLIEMNGELYSTTTWGGSGNCDYGVIGCGTVFKVNPATSTERVLYSFKGNQTEGGWAGGDLIALNGALYGTTENGGLFYEGTVYKLIPSGKAYRGSVLHTFSGYDTDGHHPNAGLLYHDGKLYGTTVLGGNNGYGIVFEVTP